MNTDQTNERPAYLDVLDQLLDRDSYTSYRISVVLNVILAANGRDSVRPQMMYNYAKNGLIVPKTPIAGETLREFTKDEVVAFIVRYCNRNKVEIKIPTAADPNQLMLDLEI